jgi:hypothetical protein
MSSFFHSPFFAAHGNKIVFFVLAGRVLRSAEDELFAVRRCQLANNKRKPLDVLPLHIFSKACYTDFVCVQ